MQNVGLSLGLNRLQGGGGGGEADPNLVVNGNFATGDLTGFNNVSTGNGTATVVSNELILFTGSTTGNRGIVDQTVVLEVGVSYRFTIINTSANTGRYFFGNVIGIRDLPPGESTNDIVANEVNTVFAAYSPLSTITSCSISLVSCVPL